MSQLDRIGVIGAGTMGAGIAQVAAAAGHEVKLHDRNADAIARGIASIRRNVEARVARGRGDVGEVEPQLARIAACAALEQLADCDFIIEAVAEDAHIKTQLLKQIEQHCAPDTLLASNTSSLSITALGASLSRPQNLVGMHFFNPAPAMKLVEVVCGAATAEDVAQRAVDIAAAWGKRPVRARNSPGFITNRVARAFYAEPLQLLQEGAADVATIDALFRGAGGFRMGPFELMDVIGNDVNYAVTESVFNAFHQEPRFRPSLLQRELVDRGLLGRKSGRGWYDYRDDNPPAAQANSVTSDFRPRTIRVCGDLGVANGLVAAAENAGIEVVREKDEGDEAGIVIEDTLLALTDGRSATARARESGRRDLVLFDLLADYADNRHIALAQAAHTRAQAMRHAVGFFNALGKTVSALDDVPGLCLMRTVCMLANEGADAVHHGVCDAAAVDDAMRYGMNHPRGPLRWAEQIGLAHVQTVLRNLRRSYQSERYRCSRLITHQVDAGTSFYDD